MMAALAAVVLAQLPAGGVAAGVGVPNSGKTTVVQEALDHAPWGTRAVVFDPYALVDRAKWNRGDHRKRPWWPRCPVLTIDELLRNPGELDRRQVRLVVTGTRGSIDKKQLGADFATLCELLQLTHDVALVGEEAGLYSRQAADWINIVATGGAHFGMRLVLLAQRMGRIEIDAREMVTTVIAGAQGGPKELQELASRCGDDFAEQVRSLRPPTPDGRPGDAPIAWRLGDGLHKANPGQESKPCSRS